MDKDAVSSGVNTINEGTRITQVSKKTSNEMFVM